MSSKSRSFVSSTLIASLAGISVCYLVAKYHTRILKRIRLILDYRNPLRYQTIEVINNADECQWVISQLKNQCADFKVLGFDCEWVTVGGTRRPIALLQLASHTGLCALFRLNLLKRIPPDLRELLEDDSIVKVGVAPFDDASYLAKDYGVCVASTMDLRFLAVLAQCEPRGLSKLSQEHLNVKLDKNWRIRCSNWEASELSPKQMEYSANDAHVAVEIFRVLAKKVDPKGDKGQVKRVLDRCFDFLDLRFKNITLENVRSNVGQSTSSNKKLLLNAQIERKICTRAKPLYHNCFLEAPDGDVLCTCAKKKAEWYVERGLGKVITEEPYTVRLLFEPSGRAVGDVGKYYQTPKINQCVVCGENNSYIRKNIIPREYRRYFPFVMKDHTSHDILLLCPRCHQLSNMADLGVRSRLAEECDAPFTHADGATKTIEIPKLKTLRSTARALYYQRDKLPPQRYEELKAIFLSYYPDETDITDELLHNAVNIEIHELNENYSAHGAKVVDFYKQKEGGLVMLERMWREHFINFMKPKYLPDLWSVEHNSQRLNIRADEGRVTEADLKSAGVNRLMAEKSNEEHKYNSDDSDSLLSQPASNNHSFDFDEDEFTIDDGYSEHIDDDNVDEIVEKC